jgi:hypothetical protein
MLFLIIIILIIVAAMGYQKYRGVQALTFTHVDITGLTLDEIVSLGTTASGSLAGRLTGGTPAAQRADGGAKWRAQIQGSVMSFSADPLPGGQGYRVGGAATTVRIGQNRIGSNQGLWGLSKAITNLIFRILGIPHNAPALVRRRNRVLRAITNAGTVIDPKPAPASIVEGTYESRHGNA